MLRDTTVTATIAVKDAAKAKQFYSETLGLKLVSDGPVSTYKSGDNLLFVYESPTAGQNPASSATWSVSKDDMEPIVKDLQDRGVKFERYDFGGGMPDGDIHYMSDDVGEGKAAWFKDPDGNILALVSM